VARLRWTPNSIAFRAELTRPATLLVDQNFDPGWRASEGLPISREGLLALPLAAGGRTLTLRHRPDGFAAGFLLTLVGIGLSAVTVRALAPTRIESLRARLRSLLAPPEDRPSG